jgi:DNA-binding SARP family transcriptional activator
MAPQHVRIRLLGGFEVQVDGVAVPAKVWRLNKARSLLKLLALAEGNRLHRDAIVEVLWPELGAVAGTNNLHQALHAARRALAEAGASAGGSSATRRSRRTMPRRWFGNRCPGSRRSAPQSVSFR